MTKTCQDKTFKMTEEGEENEEMQISQTAAVSLTGVDIKGKSRSFCDGKEIKNEKK